MADIDLQVKVGTQPKDPFAALNKGLDSTDEKVKSLDGGFGALGKTVLGLASVATVGAAFNFVLDATREMEDLTTQFIAFTGSAEGAAAQLERLSEFAAKSPFQLAEIAEANRTLLAFGSSTKDSLEQLRQLGEVSAATGKDLSDLATIFGQIQAEGKLTGERFNQLVERGVNIGPELAKSLGVAGTAIRGLISDSKISSEEVAKAFQKMTAEGGQFYGSTERLSKTVSGSISTLTDNFTILASTIGTSAVPGFTKLINLISEATAGNIAYLKEQQKIANENEAQKRIRAIGEELGTLDEKLKDLKKTQAGGFKFFGDDLLKTVSEIDAVSTSIGKLGLERLKLLKQEGISESLKKDAEAEAEKEVKRGKAREKELAAAQEQKKKLQEIEDKAAQAQADKLKEAFDQISKLESAQAAARVETEKLTSDQVAQSKIEAGDAEFVRNAEYNEAIRKANFDAAVAREAEISSAILQAKATQAELLLQFDEAEQLRRQDSQNKQTAAIKKGESDRLAVIRKAQSDEFNLFTQTENARKNFDEQTYAQRLQTANEGLNALAALTRSKSREAFELGKAAAIAQALITIPATAVKAYSSLAGIPLVGPALGAAAAAAAIIAGTEQVRQIQSQRIAFAKGGVVPGQGNKDTVPALLTPGEVVVPKQDFGDLRDSLRGSVDSDIVQLIQAGNQIQAKILDTITFGSVGEKLTLILDVLKDIESNTFGSTSSGGTTIEEVIVSSRLESQKNAPSVSSKPDERKRAKQKSNEDIIGSR